MKKTDHKDILLNDEDIKMFNNLATKMGLVGEDNASDVILSPNQDSVKIHAHNSNNNLSHFKLIKINKSPNKNKSILSKIHLL